MTVIAYENLKWSPNGDPVFRPEDWIVSGVFSTGMYDFDLRHGYAALEDVQRLLELDEDVASIVGARADDPWRADALADSVRDALGGWPYVVTSWTEDNRQLFSALKLEKLAMALILSLIVIVAALNIVGTLVMVVVNRTREIGILKAMGLTRRDTLRAFMFQGMWIGVAGTLMGTACGPRSCGADRTLRVDPASAGGLLRRPAAGGTDSVGHHMDRWGKPAHLHPGHHLPCETGVRTRAGGGVPA